MLRFSLVVTWSVVFLWIPVRLLAGEVSVDQAVAIAVENNPDLAVVVSELVVARSELLRANYVSQFNPELMSDGDYAR